MYARRGRGPLLFLFCLALSAVLAAVSGCGRPESGDTSPEGQGRAGGKPGTPPLIVGTPPSEDSPLSPESGMEGGVSPYAAFFESRPEPSGRALALVARGRPDLGDEPVVSGQARADARELVRRDAPTAAGLLVEALSRLAADDVAGHTALLSLAELVADQEVLIDYLRDLVMQPAERPSSTPTPSPVPAGVSEWIPDRPIPASDSGREPPDSMECGEQDPRRLIRYPAMALLYSAADGGSERARSTLLETLRSPNPDVRVYAVRFYYAVSRSRLRAQAEMRGRLDPRDRYLLYVN